MSLSKKTFLYSIVLAVIMAAFITGYFTLMLPSLYVDYVKRSDLDSVVEVLLFSVAREMIIEHMPIYLTLVGIVAISILFLIRKYLFVSALDKEDP